MDWMAYLDVVLRIHCADFIFLMTFSVDLVKQFATYAFELMKCPLMLLSVQSKFQINDSVWSSPNITSIEHNSKFCNTSVYVVVVVVDSTARKHGKFGSAHRRRPSKWAFYRGYFIRILCSIKNGIAAKKPKFVFAKKKREKKHTNWKQVYSRFLYIL